MTGPRTTLSDRIGRVSSPSSRRRSPGPAGGARFSAVLALAVGLAAVAAQPAAGSEPESGAGTGAATRSQSGAPAAGGRDRSPATGPGSAPAPLGRLEVGPDGRSFVTAEGEPFFWMGDTAWSLFVNLDREETLDYLDNRAEKGFTVVQAVAVSPPSGGLGPNAYGDRPYADGIDEPLTTQGDDPADDEAYDYWDHVEFVVAEAAARGMYVAILPAWSSATAGESLTSGNAQAYGEFLGTRFGKTYPNVVWMTGGDDNTGFHTEIWRAVAKGITIGTAGREDYSQTLITYHPGGGKNSASELDGSGSTSTPTSRGTARSTTTVASGGTSI